MGINIKGIKKVTFVLLAGAVIATGCGSKADTSTTGGAPNNSSTQTSDVQTANPNAETKTITHAWGTTSFEETPVKIVALDFSYIDMLTAMDVTPVATVGIGDSGFPEYLSGLIDASKVENAGQAKQPNLEILKSVKPDLIIASPTRHDIIKDQLAAIAPTVALSDASYQVVLENFTNLAAVLDKEEEAAAVVANIESKLKAGKEELSSNQPNVLVVGAFEDDFTVWIKSSFVGSLFTELGANYMFDGQKDLSAAESKTDIAKITLERLNEIEADYVFFYGNPQKWAENPLFKNIPAVKAEQAFEVSRDLWSKGRGPQAANLIIDQALEYFKTKK